MTSTIVNNQSPVNSRVHTLNRPNLVAVGTVVWLSSELMFFAGLFAVYFVARAGVSPEQWHANSSHLNLMVSIWPTLLLIGSSFTCQLGVFRAEKGDVFGLRRWYFITLILGIIFILGQVYEYRELISEGLTLSSDTYGTVFYMATGIHGMHVIGGLIAFVILMLRTRMSKFTPAQATASIVVSYYWHFVDIVWIILFATIYIIR